MVGVDGMEGVSLHIVKTFANSCQWTYSSSLIAALEACEAAAQNQGKNLVVNMSLGGSFKSRTEERAFQQATQRGVLSVAAAGNDGNTRKSYPASYSSVISVAAVDQNLNVASFSQRNSEVDIAAPGVGVLSTVPTLVEASVTTSNGKTNGTEIEFSAKTTSTGITSTLVDGGICDSASVAYSGQVVLCQRGVISFSDKVLNAQNGGAVAVVIYNNEPGGFSGTLGSDDTGVVIPAIGLSLEDGQSILLKVGSTATVVNAVDPTIGGYEFYNGTSMATPHVAAAAAMLWNAKPEASLAEIRSALESGAQDLGLPGRDDAYGHGFLNLPASYAILMSGGGGSDGGGSGGDTDSSEGTGNSNKPCNPRKTTCP